LAGDYQVQCRAQNQQPRKKAKTRQAYLDRLCWKLQVIQDVAHQQCSQHSNLVSIKQLEGAVLLREVHQPVSIPI